MIEYFNHFEEWNNDSTISSSGLEAQEEGPGHPAAQPGAAARPGWRQDTIDNINNHISFTSINTTTLYFYIHNNMFIKLAFNRLRFLRGQ